MAENLDDGEFWLPSKFLAENDMGMECKQPRGKGFRVNRADSAFGCGFNTDGFSSALFPSEFPYCAGISADLSSPVESLVGSSETESDEEEHMAELTQKMAHSTLGMGFDNTGFLHGFEKSKGRCLSRSPQSTLCQFGSECGCSHGSPTSASQVPSPRATWDLLHAAAGEVERMRLKTAYRAHHSRDLLGPPRTPSLVTVPAKDSGIDLGFYPHQSISHQQLQVAKFQILKHQQMLRQQDSVMGLQNKPTGARQDHHFHQTKQMAQNKGGRVNEIVGGRNSSRSFDMSSSKWPSLQQAQKNSLQNGSGMRALFLGNPGGKKECAGTGVFLPRQVDHPTESRRRPGAASSTVLVPAKVMQALHLKLDDMVSAELQYGSRFHGGPDTDFAVRLRLRSKDAPSPNRRNMRPPPRPVDHEIQLPQEWTY